MGPPPPPARASAAGSRPPANRRYGETCWREQFWQRQLRTAALRYREPRFYGLSPCEADPARLAAANPPAADALPAVLLARAA